MHLFLSSDVEYSVIVSYSVLHPMTLTIDHPALYHFFLHPLIDCETQHKVFRCKNGPVRGHCWDDVRSIVPSCFPLELSIIHGEDLADEKSSCVFSYGVGASVGLILEGAFTDRATWRCCSYFNIPLGGFIAGATTPASADLYWII